MLNVNIIMIPEDTFRTIFLLVIQALGEHLKLRQQVIATATVYFKRFYAR